MTARDNRGRFQNADVAAAERVLEAAVREAVAILAGIDSLEPGPKYSARKRSQAVLAHAAHAAEPLLRSAS